MYFFTVFLFLFIVVFIGVGMRFFSKEWMPTGKQLKIIGLVVLVIAIALWFARTPLNTNLYKKIQTTDEIVVLHSEEDYDNVFFTLNYDGELVPQNMGAAPVLTVNSVTLPSGFTA